MTAGCQLRLRLEKIEGIYLHIQIGGGRVGWGGGGSGDVLPLESWSNVHRLASYLKDNRTSIRSSQVGRIVVLPALYFPMQQM